MTGRPSHGTLAGSRYLALRALARSSGRPTAELLHLYGLEGFLARVQRSAHRRSLILKGGMLLAAFDLRRPTRDVDLLALHTVNEVGVVRDLIAGVASVEVVDGLAFEPGAKAAAIREGDAYAGVRVRLQARLATARLAFHVDVNVGDPVWPGPETATIPRLLDDDVIEVAAYPLVMVVAEKLVTALQRGSANTRWRDFADLHQLLVVHEPDEPTLEAALAEVARFRGAALAPLAQILGTFAPVARARWKVWRKKQGLDGQVPESFDELLATIEAKADPVIKRAAVRLR